MKVLAVETSSSRGSVALAQDGALLAERVSPEARRHTEFINQAVQDCLDEAQLQLSDIDIFCVGQGPGSFTGIRVGLNVIRSYAYAFNKPVLTLDSLSLLAQNASAPCVCTLVNAHKNLLYYNQFSRHSEEALHESAQPLQLLKPEELGQYIQKPTLCIGDAFGVYKSAFADDVLPLLLRDNRVSDYPMASTLAVQAKALIKRYGTMDWNLLTPLYIRASEAEEKLKKLKT